MKPCPPHLPAALLLAALAAGCAAAGPAGPARPRAGPSPPRAGPGGGGGALAAAVRSAPDLSWEVSKLLPSTGYLHFPDVDGGPGFFLTRNGFRYLDGDNFALRYDRTAEGFNLVEVKKRSGVQPLDKCPVYFPVQNCVERHHLLFATVVACAPSCTYRFVAFDSHSEFPITLRDPAIFGVLKRLVDPWLPPPDIEVRLDESGSLEGFEDDWAAYLQDRFDFIAAEIARAEKPPGFRLLRAPAAQAARGRDASVTGGGRGP